MSSKRKLFKTQLHQIQTVATDVYVLLFKRNFTFRAGQVVAIDLVPDGEPRLYSIASGEQDQFIQILFDEKKEGKLTPFLSKIKAGDYIYVSEPFGSFKTENHLAYWIASGTGIAPFISMARSGLSVDKTLVHGGKLDENFYFSEDLESLFPDRYFRCCSQQEDTRYFKGRLTEWLIKKCDIPLNAYFYLCGSAEMVVQVRDILISKGISFQQIVSETYF